MGATVSTVKTTLDSNEIPIKAMPILLIFPRDVFQGSFTPYLTPNDLSNLDVAVQNRQLRPALLDLMSGLIVSQFTMTHDSIMWLAKRNISVLYLRCIGGIGWCHQLSRSQIAVLMRSCAHFFYVDYEFMDQDGVELLLAHSPLLRTLQLQELQPWDKKAPSIGSADTSPVNYYTLLASLHTTNPLLDTLCISMEGSISLETIERVTETLPNLKHLDLYQCSGPNKDPIHFDKNSPISSVSTSLQKLRLFCFSEMRDAGVLSMVQCFPNLTNLNLNCCKSLTDESVIAIAKNLHNLVELCLEEIDALTDASLVALGRHSLQLISLHFFENDNFTDDGVTQLVRGCNKLQTLYLTACQGLTPQAYVAICKYCPDKCDVNLRHIAGMLLDDLAAIDNGTYGS